MNWINQIWIGIYLGSFLILFSCQSDKGFQFDKIKDLTFNVGYLTNYRFMGIIKDEDSSQELFYFGDLVTHKCIKFFNASGKLEYTVPLDNVIDSLGDIEYFEVLATDTIVVFGQHNNLLATINMQGNVWNYLDLNQIISPYQNNKLEYRPSYNGFSMNHDDLFLHVEYISKSINNPSPNLWDYFKESLDKPYFLRINHIFNESNRNYTFGLNGFYRHFMTDSIAMGELTKYSFFKNELAVFSLFSTNVYLINQNTFEITDSINVISDYSTIGSRPLDLYKNTDYSEYSNHVAKYGGYIAKIMYDEEYKIYIIVVAWENKEKKPMSRNFSYCLFSKEGVKLNEIVFDSHHYHAGLIFYYEGLYYISTMSPQDPNYDKNIVHLGKFKLRE